MSNNSTLAFRLAVVLKDNDVIHDRGILTFYDDVLQTRLADINEPKLQPTKELLLGMVDTIITFNSNNQENLHGLEAATFLKLENLAWKTYAQLIRKAYREGTALRIRHLSIK